MAWLSKTFESVWFWIALLCLLGAALFAAGQLARVHDDGELRNITWGEILGYTRVQGCGRDEIHSAISRSTAEYAASARYGGRAVLGSGLGCFGEGNDVGAEAWAVKIDATGCFISSPVVSTRTGSDSNDGIEVDKIVVAVHAGTGQAEERPFRLGCAPLTAHRAERLK